MYISFSLIINLHFQNMYMIKRLFYDVVNFHQRLHVEFCDIFY